MENLRNLKRLFDSKPGSSLDRNERKLVEQCARNMNRDILTELISQLRNKKRSKVEDYFFWYSIENKLIKSDNPLL